MSSLTHLSSLGVSKRAISRLEAHEPNLVYLENVRELSDAELRTILGVKEDGSVDRSGYAGLREALGTEGVDMAEELDPDSVEFFSPPGWKAFFPRTEATVCPEGFSYALLHPGQVVETVSGRKVRLGERDGECMPFARLYRVAVKAEDLYHYLSIYEPVRLVKGESGAVKIQAPVVAVPTAPAVVGPIIAPVAQAPAIAPPVIQPPRLG